MTDILVENNDGSFTRYKEVLQYIISSIDDTTSLITIEVQINNSWAYTIQRRIDKRKKVIIKYE